MKNFKNVLHYSIFGGLFLILFIPFIVPSSMFFPFITGKGFAFRILVEIIFAIYVVLAFADKEYRPKDTWVTRSVLLFTIVAFFADIFGVNPSKSLWSNYERMEGFVLIFHLCLFYITASSFLRNSADWKKYFDVSLFASAIASFYGIYQHMGKAVINQGGERVDATFGNATYFAIYLVFHIFIALFYLLHESSKKWQKYLYGGIIVLDTIVLYYTATRGAVLGLVGGMFVVAVYLALKERENKFYRKLSYGLLAFVALVVVGFFAVRNTDFAKSSPVLGRFRTMGIAEIKTQGRYYVWPMAIKGFEEKPILGWGQEGFNYVFNKYYNPGMFGQEEWFDRSHNVFLDWLIAGGILGFLAYLSLYISFLYYVVYKGRSTRVSDRAILLGMICAYVFHNIFVFDNLISYIMFFSVLAFVHTLYGEDLGGLDYYKNKSYSRDTINYIVLPSVTVFLLISLYFLNYPAYSANKTLIRAISPQGNLSKNLDYFKKAFSYNSFGNDEIVEQIIQAASNLPKNADPKVVSDFQNFAESKIVEKIKKTPHDARYLVFAGSYYNNIGRYDESLEYLKKALVESPNKQSILIQIGTNYLVRGDTATMMEYFRKAYDLKPSYIESAKILAIGAIYSKDAKTLQEISPKLDENSVISDDRFLRAYIGINDFNSALAIVNARLKMDPNNVQNNLTQAGIYVTIGQKQKAIEVLSKLSQNHPEYKSEIDNYIKQIQQ